MALSAVNLHVTFPSRGGKVEALRGIDLEIPKGALYVLLGPNGAGKTTLMRCITGLIKPTTGSISVLGQFSESHDSKKSGMDRKILNQLGVLIENPGVYGRLNVREYLQFFASFYDVAKEKGSAEIELQIKTLCGELNLPLENKPIAKLSQGNRQKLHLIRSLLHRPELLLWDEPTDHLDPVSQKRVLRYLKNYLAETGGTALVATHRLEQMETVATHFGFLFQGKLKHSGLSHSVLKNQDGLERIRLGFAQNIVSEDFQIWMPEFDFKLETQTGNSIVISGPELGLKMPKLISAMVTKGLLLASVEPLRSSLNSIYEQWIGE